MKYRIVKENNSSRKNFGKYKAVTVHNDTVETEYIAQEIQDNSSATAGDVALVMTELTETVMRHLKRGDRVRLNGIGLLKLEIESDKVDTPEEFNVKKNIRAIRLHIIPESYNGKQEMYEGIELHSTHPEV